MSKCIYKEIADSLNKAEVEQYYANHLPGDVATHFNFDQIYFYRIFDYLGIKRRSAAENTKLQMQLMSDSDKESRGKKISQSNTGRAVSMETRQKISDAQRGKSKPVCQQFKDRQFKKGQVAWNRGMTAPYTRSQESVNKRIATQRARHNLNTSKPEELYYISLCEEYGSEDVLRQYRDERYPFYCDFYIKSKDLFIELNLYWSHGGRPFDPDSAECMRQLEAWQEKAETSRQYRASIETWTIRDVKKLKTAQQNNLNYKVIYKL